MELLERLKPTLPNVYLLSPMPDIYRQTKDEYHLPKGVSNRNKGLEWILKFGVDDAVVYFADDDNTYDLRLFHEVLDKSKFERQSYMLEQACVRVTSVFGRAELIGCTFLTIFHVVTLFC